MPLQRSHGKPYPLVSAPDELPEGQAAPRAEPSGPVARRSGGQVATAEAARELGKRGGLKSARRRADAKAWGSSLGLGRLLEGWKDDASTAPFIVEGERWYEAQCAAVARDVGGGQLSPGVTSILRTAAWERLYASFLFDAGTRNAFAWEVTEKDGEGNPKRILPRTELLLVAARLGDASRQNLLAAHELAAREGAERKKSRSPVDAQAELRRRLIGGGA